ncbi:MAG: ribosome biogenesis GTP-binding protein YihA/YsxC [Gammaproteobacteria bacterium]
MHAVYQQARFLTSVRDVHRLPADKGFEVAFAGRSNAGKSSAINTICQQKALARTSRTPGRTQMINFFTIDGERRLVDLPGYGYAKAPTAMRRDWRILVEGYLAHRQSLRGIVIMMDIRRPLTDYDWQLLNWCQQAKLGIHILLTKADKLRRGPRKSTLTAVRSDLGQAGTVASVSTFSALKSDGLNEAWVVLDEWLKIERPKKAPV